MYVPLQCSLSPLGMGCSDATPADVDMSITEGPEDPGLKTAEAGGDAASGSTAETVPTGFKVLGGFENKPVQKVLFYWYIYCWLQQSNSTLQAIKIFYLCVDRFTECFPSGSLSLTWFTETLKATWFLSLMFQRFLQSSLKNFSITEFSIFSLVTFIFAAFCFFKVWQD